MKIVRLGLSFFVLVVVSGASCETELEVALEREMDRDDWAQVFVLSDSNNWEDDWFLDGKLGQVESGAEGLVLRAGPNRGEDSSHVVLWTKQEFEGDLWVQYNYTRLDEAERDVCIIYLHARGTGEEPFAGDISRWNELREVPAMRVYFNNMAAYHVSYAAFFNGENVHGEYVQARRYPVPAGGSFADTGLSDREPVEGLIESGKTYHISVLLSGDDLYFSATEKGTDTKRVFRWKLGERERLIAGRIGLRHMWTRAARYENFMVWQRNVEP